MKKVLIPFIASLAISASCFASGGTQLLAAEEKVADEVVAALTGNSVTYETISQSFSAPLKQNLTAANFAAMKKQIRDKIGNVKNVNFVTFTRQYNLKDGYNNVDDLVYFGSAGKDKYARIVIHFVEEKGSRKVGAFDVSPINAAPAQAAPAKNAKR